MRKNLFYLVVVSVMTFAFFGCSKDSDGDSITLPPENKKSYRLEKTDLVGVWRSASYDNAILSFSSNKLFSGLLDEYTIDDGDYSVVGDTIKINNSYLGYNIRFEINNATDKTISGKLKYLALDSQGNTYENTKSITLNKTDEPACERRNILIGKSFSFQTVYLKGSKYTFSITQHNLMTYTLTTISNGKVNQTGISHYIYLHPKMYYTTYNEYGVFLHMGQYVVNTKIVDINPDGSVTIHSDN